MTVKRPPARVASLQFGHVPVESLNRQVGVRVKVGEQSSDLGQAHIDTPQHGNEPSGVDLNGPVAAVAV